MGVHFFLAAAFFLVPADPLGLPRPRPLAAGFSFGVSLPFFGDASGAALVAGSAGESASASASGAGVVAAAFLLGILGLFHKVV